MMPTVSSGSSSQRQRISTSLEKEERTQELVVAPEVLPATRSPESFKDVRESNSVTPDSLISLLVSQLRERFEGAGSPWIFSSSTCSQDIGELMTVYEYWANVSLHIQPEFKDLIAKP